MRGERGLDFLGKSRVLPGTMVPSSLFVFLKILPYGQVFPVRQMESNEHRMRLRFTRGQEGDLFHFTLIFIFFVWLSPFEVWFCLWSLHSWLPLGKGRGMGLGQPPGEQQGGWTSLSFLWFLTAQISRSLLLVCSGAGPGGKMQVDTLPPLIIPIKFLPCEPLEEKASCCNYWACTPQLEILHKETKTQHSQLKKRKSPH